MTQLEVGQTAPAFEADTDDMGLVTLDQFKGQNVLLFFYPKDNTPGCTTESKDFSDLKSDFEKLNCKIIGVSADSLKKHQNFREKHDLSVTLASDPDHKMLENYGVWQEKKNFGKTYMGIVRTTILIDKDQKITKIWPKVKVKGHAQECLDFLTSNS